MIPRCQHCSEQLPVLARRHAKFCSGRCRVAAHRVRHANPVPLELRREDRWVCHNTRKVPMRPNGRAASSTDPATWSTYAAVTATRFAGVGFVLNGDGIACIDLDHCLEDGRVANWAQAILDLALGTYVETSPSGTGLHIWGRATIPAGRCTPRGEVYGTGRYITITGRRFGDAPSTLGDISAAARAIST